jgi:hypothetical protein
MASNYDRKGGLEMGEPHKHSDGEEQVEVNAFHSARMTAGAGSSEESYPGLVKDDEKEVTDSPVQDSEASTGTPREDTGKRM